MLGFILGDFSLTHPVTLFQIVANVKETNASLASLLSNPLYANVCIHAKDGS
jgi:hypothetical protein